MALARAGLPRYVQEHLQQYVSALGPKRLRMFRSSSSVSSPPLGVSISATLSIRKRKKKKGFPCPIIVKTVQTAADNRAAKQSISKLWFQASRALAKRPRCREQVSWCFDRGWWGRYLYPSHTVPTRRVHTGDCAMQPRIDRIRLGRKSKNVTSNH